MKKNFCLIVLISTLGIISCNSSKKKHDKRTVSTENFISAQFVTLKTFNEVNAIGKGNGSVFPCLQLNNQKKNDSSNSFEITYKPNCKGNMVSDTTGKVIVSLDENYGMIGSSVKIKLDSLLFPHYLVYGSIRYSFLTEERIDFHSNIILVDTDGRKSKWTAGYTILNIKSKNEMLISGRSSGNDISGTDYISKITGPLKLPNDCPFITAGSVYLTPGELSQRLIMYDDNGCANSVIVKIKDKKYTLPIH